MKRTTFCRIVISTSAYWKQTALRSGKVFFACGRIRSARNVRLLDVPAVLPRNHCLRHRIKLSVIKRYSAELKVPGRRQSPTDPLAENPEVLALKAVRYCDFHNNHHLMQIGILYLELIKIGS